MPFYPLGRWGSTLVSAGSRSPNFYRVTAQEIVMSGPNSVIRSQNYDGTQGWAAFGDGTATFYSVTLSGGDIKSANWDGGSDLSGGKDGGASLGYFLDGSAGAAQFQEIYAEGGEMGNLIITGDLTLSGGRIFTDLPGNVRLALETSKLVLYDAAGTQKASISLSGTSSLALNADRMTFGNSGTGPSIELPGENIALVNSDGDVWQITTAAGSVPGAGDYSTVLGLTFSAESALAYDYMPISVEGYYDGAVTSYVTQINLRSHVVIGTSAYAGANGLNIAAGNLVFEGASYGLGKVTGSYGNVQTTGTGKGSWEGYSVNGHFVFMSNSPTNGGIYNDYSNKWQLYFSGTSTNLYNPNGERVLYSVDNSYTYLYYNGTWRFRTTNLGVEILGYQEIKNGNVSGTFYGPNTSWGGYLYVGSGSEYVTTTRACVLSTNGNLHLEPGDGKSIYMNYYSSGKQVLFNYGTVSLPSITFAGDVDTGIYRPTTNQWAVAVAGVKELLIGTTGFIVPNVYNSTSSGAANVYVDSSGRMWRSTSTEQNKRDIRPWVKRDSILDVTPVTFYYLSGNAPKGEKMKRSRNKLLGLTHEDVKKHFPKGATKDLALDWNAITTALLAEVKELRDRVVALEASV